MRFDESLEYISGDEVMSIYKVKKSWLYASVKRNNIPLSKIASKNYYCLKQMDALIEVAAEIEALTEWHHRGCRNTLFHDQGILAPPNLSPPYYHQSRIWLDVLF